MAGRILTLVAVITWVVASLAVALAAASEGTLVVASWVAAFVVASWAAALAATSLVIALATASLAVASLVVPSWVVIASLVVAFPFPLVEPCPFP